MILRNKMTMSEPNKLMIIEWGNTMILQPVAMDFYMIESRYNTTYKLYIIIPLMTYPFQLRNCITRKYSKGID